MASRGVNKVILVGFLGQDPEIRYLPAGGAVATLSLVPYGFFSDTESGRDGKLSSDKKMRIEDECTK